MQEFVAYHHLCSLSSVNNITSASSFPYCPPLNVVVLKGNEREREREREKRERGLEDILPIRDCQRSLFIGELERKAPEKNGKRVDTGLLRVMLQ
jgi:hypothetical protein